jgi:hypothetical protein
MALSQARNDVGIATPSAAALSCGGATFGVLDELHGRALDRIPPRGRSQERDTRVIPGSAL